MKLIESIAAKGTGYWCATQDAQGRRLFVGGTDFQIHTYTLSAVSPTETGTLKGHSSYVTALAYLPASKQLVSGSLDKSLIWWKDGAEAVRRVDAGQRINALVASVDGAFLAAACGDGVGRLWDANTGALIHVLGDGHPRTTDIGRLNTLYSIALCSDGKLAATGDRAGTIALWDTASAKRIRQISAKVFYSQALQQEKLASEYEWGGVRCLHFLPDGKWLVAGGMGAADQNSAGIDGPMRLEIFDVTTGKSVTAFQNNTHKGMLTTLSVHGDILFAGGGGGKAGDSGVGSLWEWNFKQRDKEGMAVAPAMQASEVVARAVVPSEDGKILYVAGMLKDVTAGRTEVWDLTSATKAETSPAPSKK
jgi:WD40 repeat protein